jgi:peptide/nickel transport system substrate-binding protein
MRKRILSVLSLLMIFSLLAACGPTPAPQIVKETVPVEVTKEVVVKETVPVEVTKQVVVKETVPVEVTAVPTEVPAAQTTFPRNETIYVAGSAWGPPSTWNPFQPGSLANTTGTIGFLYEFLFGYDPFTGEMIPWLAESGTWTNPTTYDVVLRQGLTWSDGQPLTSADVKYTYELGKQYAAIWFSPMWRYLTGVEATDDLHLTFTFNDPLYQEFENNLFNIPIVPKHLWESKSEEDITVGANENPVASGAYLYMATGADRNIWVRNDNWWGNDVFGKPAPKYIVDILTSSNNAALGMVIKGELDLSNNFLPGVAELANKGYVQTYFAQPPYMLSANTAVLFLNTTKKPMDDPAFRKALAFAIDVPSIVNTAYAQLVSAASPSGLLPTLSNYIDQDVMNRLGYSFDTAKAKQMLAAAGYKDVNGDGMVEAPDGSKFELQVTCPNGWTDWMAAIDVIAKSAQAAGINIKAATPDYGAWNTDLMGGTFDMTLNNWASLSNTPWKLYNLLFSHPIMDQMQNGNFGRYENQDIFDLVDALARVPMSDEQGMKDACSNIQEAMLTEMPMIPLWYNGMWAQWSTSTWTNWPTEKSPKPTTPTTWSGYWQLGSLQTLIDLKPVNP